MSEQVKITWHGHSCFKIEDEGFSIVIDPYLDGKVPGLKNLRLEASSVICSHDHDDHGYVEAVTIVDTDKESPFDLTLVACPHDDEGGMKRGMNMIHVLDNGSLRIAHFGDIGCPLNDAQREKIGKLDVAMLPVGGFFTMEPDGIEELIEQLKTTYTIVIVTHSMQQASRVSDDTAFFLLGEIVEADTTRKLFSKPADQRTEDYITGRFG